MHDLSRHQKEIGLTETELRARLNRLQELHILPEHRVQPGLPLCSAVGFRLNIKLFYQQSLSGGNAKGTKSRHAVKRDG